MTLERVAVENRHVRNPVSLLDYTRPHLSSCKAVAVLFLPALSPSFILISLLYGKIKQSKQYNRPLPSGERSEPEQKKVFCSVQGKGGIVLELTSAQKQALHGYGFVHLPGIVPQELIHNALRAIHSSVGSEGIEPAQLPIFRSQSYCPELMQTAHITNLLYKSPLWSLAESVIGVNAIQPVTHGQIALRFPTMDETPHQPQPHIDGMYTPTNGVPKGKILNFTALVGVFLSDVPHDFMGNLTFWPGTHLTHSQYFQKHGPQSLLNGMPSIELPAPQQVTARAGDAVLCHYLLGHGVAGNVSPFIRYATFFRLIHQNHANWSWETMTNPWLEWAGMQDTVKSSNQLA